VMPGKACEVLLMGLLRPARMETVSNLALCQIRKGAR
jgi:hypothetical protein